MSKDKKVWQIQRALGVGDTGKPEWRDVCSELAVPGPTSKDRAVAFVARLRESCPHMTYRIVKVSPL